MNGKERLTRILHGKPVDRISWTTIADNVSRFNMPGDYRDIDVLDFYRKIGCDILQFGYIGLPEGLPPLYPFQVITEVTERVESLPDNIVITTKELGGKTLTAVSQNGHPVKYPVQTAKDLAIYLDMVEASSVTELSINNDDSYAYCDTAIGDDGIFAPTMNPSPVQQLIEFDCGIESFYYLLNDHTELMERVLNNMFERKYEECRLIAEKTPFELIIPIENTSTAMISPALYRKYSLPHLKAYVDIIHKNNKKAIIHMCGHLKNLLPELKETGLDGIHALTPPQTGDCPYESALDIIGNDLVIIGIFYPEVLHDPLATADDIKNAVKSVLKPRIKDSNFVLCPGIDGIITDLWRLEAFNEAMEEYGKRK